MGRTGRLTLLQQNDTHAYLELHWEHFWRNGRAEYRRAGGYARAATIAKRIKAEVGGACLFVDCGDTIHGTGPAQWTQGAAIVPALNAMGIGLMTPGITLGDLWQMVPTDPEVFTVEMTGEEVRRKLEASLESVYAADPFQQRGGYIIRVSGLNAVVRLNNPKGARVEHLDIAGAPYDAKRRYTIAAAGEQDISGENKRPTGATAIEALRRYFKRRSPVKPLLTHAKFIAV